MPTSTNQASSVSIQVDTQELSSQQGRLIKTINSLLTHVLSTDEEADYFESSSELLRVVATAIKKANFSKSDDGIDYSKQALEFCVDILNDQVYEDSLVQYDN